MAELFGFRITRSKDEGTDSVILPTSDDGAGDIAGGGFYSQFLDIDGRDRTEADLIRRYRDIAQQPECDMAVEDIINESIVSDEKDQSVSLITDRLPYQQKVKNRIREEFDSVLRLLDFNSKGHDIFRRWYVDGRIYFHKIIDKNAPEKGVTELRYIDPRKIKKVRQVIKDRDDNNTEIIKGVEEFYIYNEKGIDVASGTSTGLKITSDSIAYCPSGVIDAQKGTVLSHLHKAIELSIS